MHTIRPLVCLTLATAAEKDSLSALFGLEPPENDHDRAELGYWIGLPYWGRGYATEAGLALLRHGFEARGLNRIFAVHFSRNPASGRVLQKIGMRPEGMLPQHVKKWGVYVDLVCYGALRDEWLRDAPGASSPAPPAAR